MNYHDTPRPEKSGDWFAPKRFGYGAGLPIAWQGWATLALYGAAVGGAMALLIPRHPYPFVAITLIATAALIVIAGQHTRGGWKWRWGAE